MLRLSNKKNIIIAIMLITPQLSSAQIEEFIEDQITDYVTGKAEDYIDEISGGLYGKAKQFYYNPVGTIWESYIRSDVQRSVNAKAKELESFKVNEKELTRLRTKFGISEKMPTDTKTMFMPVRYGISEYFAKSLIQTNKSISKYTNDSIHRNYIDSLKAPLRYNKLEDVLNMAVIDSIDMILDNNAKLLLLKDLNESRGLSGLLNRHPEAVRVYFNSINTDLRTNTTHLYYWGVLADSHKSKLPKKAKLINPRFIVFNSNSEGNQTLIYNNITLGYYTNDGRTFKVLSPELLNLMPKPNSIYVYKETYMVIDNLGRLSSARLSINKQGKTIEKTNIKFKDLAKSLDATNKNDLYSKLLKKLKEQPSVAFLAETGNQLSSSELSQLNKTFKELRKKKSNPLIDISINYEQGSTIASIIKIDETDKTGFEDLDRKDFQENYLGIKEKAKNILLSKIRAKKNVYQGAIDGRYPIVVNLCLLGYDEMGDISGDYFYSKFGNTKRMIIKGNYVKKEIKFAEYDDSGKKFGDFKGTISGNKISGKFIKNGKEMPFSISTK